MWNKRNNKAVDSGDYDELQKAISKSAGEVSARSPRRSRSGGLEQKLPLLSAEARLP